MTFLIKSRKLLPFTRTTSTYTVQARLVQHTKESWNVKMTKPLLNRDEGTLEELYKIVIEDRRGRIKGRTPSKGMYDEKHQKKKGTEGK